MRWQLHGMRTITLNSKLASIDDCVNDCLTTLKLDWPTSFI
jgi:hypothetical protein